MIPLYLTLRNKIHHFKKDQANQTEDKMSQFK